MTHHIVSNGYYPYRTKMSMGHFNWPKLHRFLKEFFLYIFYSTCENLKEKEKNHDSNGI